MIVELFLNEGMIYFYIFLAFFNNLFNLLIYQIQ